VSVIKRIMDELNLKSRKHALATKWFTLGLIEGKGYKCSCGSQKFTLLDVRGIGTFTKIAWDFAVIIPKICVLKCEECGKVGVVDTDNLLMGN